MDIKKHLIIMAALTILWCIPTVSEAQEVGDSIVDLLAIQPQENLLESISLPDSLAVRDSEIDSLLAEFDIKNKAIPWSADQDPYFKNFDPVPLKALWYSVLFPGGGQIYNRKYWKLPIIYGGYLGLIYGFQFNQRYYRTYSNAYRDLVLNSPNKSYMDFLPPNYNIENNRSYLEKTFQRKRNYYRQYRDYCLVGMIGVYLVAMVDAYVDASLYHFDVSTNLDANNRPTLMLGYHIDF